LSIEGWTISTIGVHAGDIIQYRDVTIVTHQGLSTETITAPHHTAVISQVLGHGIYKVLEQNVGGDMHVREDTINLAAMTSGTVWIYQPVKR
jgi:hypothetical protein